MIASRAGRCPRFRGQSARCSRRAGQHTAVRRRPLRCGEPSHPMQAGEAWAGGRCGCAAHPPGCGARPRKSTRTRAAHARASDSVMLDVKGLRAVSRGLPRRGRDRSHTGATPARPDKTRVIAPRAAGRFERAAVGTPRLAHGGACCAGGGGAKIRTRRRVTRLSGAQILGALARLARLSLFGHPSTLLRRGRSVAFVPNRMSRDT